MKIVDSINQNGLLLGSWVDFLEAWLNLAEKLANSRSILYSPHGIPLPPTTHPDEEQPLYHPLFNPLSFVIRAQKVRMKLAYLPLSKAHPRLLKPLTVCAILLLVAPACVYMYNVSRDGA